MEGDIRCILMLFQVWRKDEKSNNWTYSSFVRWLC